MFVLADLIDGWRKRYSAGMSKLHTARNILITFLAVDFRCAVSHDIVVESNV